MLNVSLEDKYLIEKGRVFVNGTQVLVKLPLIQKILDENKKLNTSGFISGYRGSPLGNFDRALWQASSFLKKSDINFSPGLNEDLAATAVWGSQQPSLISESINDGVFAIWYGKGPGVDRSGDAFKHGNAAGTSKNGGVLLLLGDDHTAKSSTLAHQSEFAMLDAQIPILNPSNIYDLLEFGIFGWELSRFSGLWVSMKCITSIIDSTASIEVDNSNLNFIKPILDKTNLDVHIRLHDNMLEQEKRIPLLKLPSALKFAEINNINKIIWNKGFKNIGIIATGKAYADTMECLSVLNINDKRAKELGIHLLKVGMTWPLENDKIRQFSNGLQELLIIEEKRSFLEANIKNLLYNTPNSPKIIVGKTDEKNNELIKADYEIDKSQLKKVIISRIEKNCKVNIDNSQNNQISNVKTIKEKDNIERTPYFCSGCPHNTSTKVPKNSKAMAGIGCHFMAAWMNRNTSLYTHMGAEGTNWIGMSPFVKDKHIFQNIGDGTFNHSGTLAIRAAVAAKVNITYKILYNDAVAMTGGQPVDGLPSTPQISHQLYGEGVKKIAIVTDEIEKYKGVKDIAKGTTIHHRKELELLQNEFKEIKGVTVIIYDQTCATEKRRRRKRGQLEDPNKRIFINHLVCEGCGDCSVESNCISVEPLKTEYGTKRKINQSTCNKDYSCANGFCPSFLSIEGGSIKKKLFKKIDDPLSRIKKLNTPKNITLKDNSYNILVTGVGGTGVVTIGALIGMAAHIEKKGVSILDQVGIAQKGGAVLSHIKIANKPENIYSAQIAANSTDLLLGCDIVVSASKEVRKLLDRKKTSALINNHETPLSQFVLNPDFTYSTSLTANLIKNDTLEIQQVNASELSKSLFGDTILSNIFLVGYAIQKGNIPISIKALEKAIIINGVSVEANLSALNWGRLAADDLKFVLDKSNFDKNKLDKKLPLNKLIDNRYNDLIKYHNIRYAEKFKQIINKVISVDNRFKTKNFTLTRLVVNTLFKTMAYKDEFEVARLYTDPRFKKYLYENFEGDIKLGIYLSPPMLNLKDHKTKKPKKVLFSNRIFILFNILKKLKFIRNTPLNIFAYSLERRKEKMLIDKILKCIDLILLQLDNNNYRKSIDLIETFNSVRGFGHIKMRNFKNFEVLYEQKLSDFKKNSKKKELAAE
ncbi:MAG: indolepyruvate ferredoxin oxidoreductase [Rickettsiales bacterium]|nr:indolepyruvate ferredoxin oxidoreductase [Rickettsiales bacterium]